MYVNAKMIPIETIPGMGEGGIKDNSEGDEFKCQCTSTQYNAMTKIK
jgi:hypothetical protein